MLLQQREGRTKKVVVVGPRLLFPRGHLLLFLLPEAGHDRHTNYTGDKREEGLLGGERVEDRKRERRSPIRLSVTLGLSHPPSLPEEDKDGEGGSIGGEPGGLPSPSTPSIHLLT